jgi:hypothetical protein
MIETSANPFIASNNPKIGPKAQNKSEFKKLIEFRFTILDDGKGNEHLNGVPLIE